MSLSKPTMEFITTKRDREKLLYDGRQYHKIKTYVNENVFWKCYNKTGCKGNVTLSNENHIVKEGVHDIDCLPNSAKYLVLKKMKDLKTKIVANVDPIQKQFEEVVCELEDDGVHLVADLPKFDNIKSGLYKARNKALGVSKLHFESPTKVEIPKKYKNFLLADYNDNDTNNRILIFSSSDIKTYLDNFEHFFLDGTFKSCPEPFTQIYTIHGLHKITKKMVPLFFGFIHNKTENTYKLIFEMIKSQIPEWNPVKLTLDYEISAMKAIRKIFPNAVMKGCYYHFCASLFKKAKRLGIKSTVQRRHIARCAGLARLPLRYVMAGYKYTMTKSPKTEAVIKFNNYLNRYWFSEVNFIKTWCCYGEEIRTTNNLEGWHARLNRMVGRQKASLATILNVLIKETKISMSFKTNKNTSNKNYQEIDQEIADTIHLLTNKSITVGHCLEIIAPFKY